MAHFLARSFDFPGVDSEGGRRQTGGYGLDASPERHSAWRSSFEAHILLEDAGIDCQ